jgi:hypothetical protein
MVLDNPISYDSKIMSAECFDFVDQELIEGKDLELIYRGSDHGFKASDFHTKCDNIADTLVVIQSNHGKVFGGRTSKMWNHCDRGWMKEDGSAFIFSLDNKTKFNVKPGMKYNAIGCKSSYGPCFGADIVIRDNCNTATDNFSDFGFMYTLPAGMS